MPNNFYFGVEQNIICRQSAANMLANPQVAEQPDAEAQTGFVPRSESGYLMHVRGDCGGTPCGRHSSLEAQFFCKGSVFRLIIDAGLPVGIRK